VDWTARAQLASQMVSGIGHGLPKSIDALLGDHAVPSAGAMALPPTQTTDSESLIVRNHQHTRLRSAIAGVVAGTNGNRVMTPIQIRAKP